MTAARQIQTRRWWEEKRSAYELYASALVIEEASRGDTELATEPLAALETLPLLAINNEIELIGQALVERTALPSKATVDALHISTAAFHGVEYLLTWNCKHIAKCPDETSDNRNT